MEQKVTPGGEEVYEVTYFDRQQERRLHYGDALTPEGAEAMCNSIRIFPGMSDPRAELKARKTEPVIEDKPVSKKRSYE